MSIVRLGVMGGTFDPIHLGHLKVAEEVAKTYGLDSVIFVPAGDPWQKPTNTPASDRLEMTKLAIAGHPTFQLSTVDVDRTGPTYTVDTLRDLHLQFPEAHFYFIIGADSLESINTWKNADELWGQAHFVGVSRPGHLLKAPESPHDAVSLLEISELPVSSSEIRAKVMNGEPIDDLVPESVMEYIKKNDLYQRAK